MNINVYLPDELGQRAKHADLPFSQLLRAAVHDELERRRAHAEQVRDLCAAYDDRELAEMYLDLRAAMNEERELARGIYELSAAVRSLNDVVSELVAGLASGDQPSRGWAYVAVGTLAEHTRTLAGDPSLDTSALEGWEGVE